MGRLMEFWGFRRHMGRLWTILYLSPETRQEFLVSCECDMSQAIKTLAGLFPVWVLVLRLGMAVFLRARG